MFRLARKGCGIRQVRFTQTLSALNDLAKSGDKTAVFQKLAELSKSDFTQGTSAKQLESNILRLFSPVRRLDPPRSQAQASGTTGNTENADADAKLVNAGASASVSAAPLFHNKKALSEDKREELAKDLDMMIQAVKKLHEVGAAGEELTKTAMEYALLTSQPDRAIETWVAFMEAQSQTESGLNGFLNSGKSNSACILTLAAYCLSQGKNIPSPQFAKRLIPGKNPGQFKSADIKKTLEFLPISMQKQARSDIRLLQFQGYDWNSSLTLAKVRDANIDQLVPLYQAALVVNQSMPITEEFWAAFIQRYAEVGKAEQAFNVWNDMQKSVSKPGQVAWAALMRAASMQKDGSLVFQQIWDRWQATAQEKNEHIIQARLAALNREGNYIKAIAEFQEVLAQTPQFITPLVFNTALASYLTQRDLEGAEKLIEQVSASGNPVKLNNSALNSLLRIAMITHDEERASKFLNMLIEGGSSPDEDTYTTVLQQLFNNARRSREDIGEKIVILLEEMNANKVPMSPRFMTVLADGIAKHTSDVSIARAIYERIKTHNLTIHTYTSLINNELNSGSFEMAQYYYQKLSRSNITMQSSVHNLMLQGALNAGELSFAQKIFTGMTQAPEYAKPNLYTVMSILSQWAAVDLQGNPRAANLVNEALAYLENHLTSKMDYPLGKAVMSLYSSGYPVSDALRSKADYAVQTGFDHRIAKRSQRNRR